MTIKAKSETFLSEQSSTSHINFFTVLESNAIILDHSAEHATEQIFSVRWLGDSFSYVPVISSI